MKFGCQHLGWAVLKISFFIPETSKRNYLKILETCRRIESAIYGNLAISTHQKQMIRRTRNLSKSDIKMSITLLNKSLTQIRFSDSF
jgi:hypothetical protein